jgi:hypothetical protein
VSNPKSIRGIPTSDFVPPDQNQWNREKSFNSAQVAGEIDHSGTQIVTENFGCFVGNVHDATTTAIKVHGILATQPNHDLGQFRQ